MTCFGISPPSLLPRPHPGWARLNCLTNTDPNLLPFTTLYLVMSSNSIIWTPMCPMYPMRCFVATLKDNDIWTFRPFVSSPLDNCLCTCSAFSAYSVKTKALGAKRLGDKTSRERANWRRGEMSINQDNDTIARLLYPTCGRLFNHVNVWQLSAHVSIKVSTINNKKATRIPYDFVGVLVLKFADIWVLDSNQQKHT